MPGPNERRASVSWSVAIVALLACTLALDRFASMPTMIDGLILVSLAGIAAWRCAAATARPARIGPKPANDNPPRPLLPLHTLQW